MQLIYRTEEDTEDTLIWCGDDFDPLATQVALRNSGLTLLEVREDRWARVGLIHHKEQEDGQQQGS